MPIDSVEPTSLLAIHTKIFTEIIEYIKTTRESYQFKKEKEAKFSDVLDLDQAINYIIRKQYTAGNEILLKLVGSHVDKVSKFAIYLLAIISYDYTEEKITSLIEIYTKNFTLIDTIDIYGSVKNYNTDETFYKFTAYTAYDGSSYAIQQLAETIHSKPQNSFNQVFQGAVSQTWANTILKMLFNSPNNPKILTQNIHYGLQKRNRLILTYYKRLSEIGFLKLRDRHIFLEYRNHRGTPNSILAASQAIAIS